MMIEIKKNRDSNLKKGRAFESLNPCFEKIWRTPSYGTVDSIERLPDSYCGMVDPFFWNNQGNRTSITHPKEIPLTQHEKENIIGSRKTGIFLIILIIGWIVLTVSIGIRSCS